MGKSSSKSACKKKKADSSSTHTGPRHHWESEGTQGSALPQPRAPADPRTTRFCANCHSTRCPEGNRPLQREAKNGVWQCCNRTAVLLGKCGRINESKAARPSHGAGLGTAARGAAPEPQVSRAGHGKSLGLPRRRSVLIYGAAPQTEEVPRSPGEGL